MKQIHELVVQSFADPATRPAALARYLEAAADAAPVAPALLEAALVDALTACQVIQADSARQAAERLDAEEHTENLLQLLGTILESSDEGILALDTEDRIIRFNSRLVSLFAIPDEVIAFWRHEEVMAALLAQLADPAAFSRSLAQLCQSPEADWRETLECVDGRVIEWRSQPQPAVWAGVKRVISFLDVTERFRSETNRRLLEHKLDETRERLLQAEKLAAIFQLSAGLAHEISNPIGFIQSNLEAMGRYVHTMLGLLEIYAQAEHDLPPEGARMAALGAAKKAADLEFLRDDVVDLLDESLRGTRRLATMVGSLRVLAHAQGSAMQTVGLVGLLDAALAAADAAAGGRVRIRRSVEDALQVECRPSELGEALKNLLHNARDAIAGEGEINIGAGTDERQVWLEIADTGCGIAGENLSRIFEPFFTTKPPGAGMGLGLSVAYAIVAMHGGTITATSEAGRGSTFRICLPRHQAAAPTP
ncbi:sensor histidine kinase [Quatrionicoccus australiensis]|uniref:sensor histidine kinase n=1 Tax=Quatrionicoccus australiensis TaxID=138118 RepID=UPI001CFB74AF|nr:ATP-binding protein [Quatrionicoccus australiensis]MCB4361134.1 PAS-domain containing protein [Quatrionicoccus australiensis]